MHFEVSFGVIDFIASDWHWRSFIDTLLLQNAVYKADPGSAPSVYDPPM